MARDSFGNKGLSPRSYQSYIDVGVDKTAVRVNDATISSNKLTISAESVSFSAGAIGTTGVVSLDKAPIYNVDGSQIGQVGDTSLAWITGTILTTEVQYRQDLNDAEQAALMANGEYALEYDLGRIRYKKATTGTSDTCNYSSRQMNIEITGDTDIQIGAVEIKDGATDNRADVNDANTARTTATHVLAVQEIGADGTVPPTGSLLTNAPFARLTDTVTNVDVLPLTSATVSTGLISVAGEIRDFDTSAGDDPTPAIGILGESPAGARPIHIEIDDGAMDATPPFIPIGGEYRATATTYTDGDAAVLQTDINGHVKISGRNAHDTAVIASGVQTLYESKDFDGSALPVDVTVVEGDAVRPASTLTGISYIMPVNEDGSLTTIYGEDSIHSSGHGGTFILAVRNDAGTTLAGTDGDYAPLSVDANGALHVALTSVDYVDDSVFAIATDRILGIGFLADDVSPDSVDEGDIGIPRMTTNRKLWAHSDGIYNATTSINLNPETMGLIVHANAAAPGVTNQTVRTTGGVSSATITSANFFGIDTRSKLYGTSGTDDAALTAITQDAAFGTASVGMALFGKYQATPTTYTDNDAAPILLDANGRIVLSSDIEIGAVELKDGTTDNRVEIKAPNGEAFGFGLKTMPARYMLTPPTLTDTFSSPLLLGSRNQLLTNLYDGTNSATLIVQDAAFGTASVGLPLFGKYQATPTTYTDNDAAPILLDANGRIVLSSDIQIGAVEIKDGTTDNRVEVKAPNAEAFSLGLKTMPARYMLTPPTLTDTFTAPLLLDSTGKLVTSASNVEYVDDGNGFTVATSRGVAVMAIATTDSVDSGDVGALAMTTSRRLHVATAALNSPAVTNATGALALSTTTAVANHFRLVCVTCHFSAAPTTSENFVVTLDASDGAAYDTVLFSVDPSATAATDVVYIPDKELLFETGDEILVTFTNTDLRTYGLRIVTQLV